jgi:hypothetical protein
MAIFDRIQDITHRWNLLRHVSYSSSEGYSTPHLNPCEERMRNARERHPYRWWHFGSVLVVAVFAAILAFADSSFVAAAQLHD